MKKQELDKFLNKKVSIYCKEVYFMRNERKESNNEFQGTLVEVKEDHIRLINFQGLDTLITIEYIDKCVELIDAWR